MLQVRHPTINSICTIVVEVERILKSEHLLRPDVIEDLQLIFREFLKICFLVEDALVVFSDGSDFVENGFALFG